MINITGIFELILTILFRNSFIFLFGGMRFLCRAMDNFHYIKIAMYRKKIYPQMRNK